MKKIVTLLLTLIAVVACSKTEPDLKPVTPTPEKPDRETPTPTPQPLPTPTETHYISSVLKTNEARHSSVRITYQYDSDMRLIGLEHRLNYGATDLVYTAKLTHTPTLISMEYDEYKHHEELNKPTEYYLNLDEVTKRAARFTRKRYFTRNNATDMHDETDFIFDDKERQTVYASSFMEEGKMTWTEGNLTKLFYKRPSYTATEERTYTEIKNNIYPDLNLFLVKMYLSPDYKYLFATRLGLKSTHILKSSHRVYTDGTPREELSFTYELDDKGRPIRITENGDTTDKDIYTLTYITQ